MKRSFRHTDWLVLLAIALLASGSGCISKRIVKRLNEEIAAENLASRVALLKDEGFAACFTRQGPDLSATVSDGAGSCAVDGRRQAEAEPPLTGRYPFRSQGTVNSIDVAEASIFFVELLQRTDGRGVDDRTTLRNEYGSEESFRDYVRKECDPCAESSCPPAKSAVCVAYSDELGDLTQINDAIDQMARRVGDGDVRPSSVTNSVRTTRDWKLSLSGIRRFIRLIDNAAYADGFGVASEETAKLIAAYQTAKRPVAPDAILMRERLAYISEYIKAYFREGQVFAYAVDFAPLRAEARDAITGIDGVPHDPATVDAIEASLKKWFPDVQGERGGVGFVSRGGTITEQFSGMKAEIAVGTSAALSIDGPKETPLEVGHVLVRLVVEGWFDAVHRLPAVENATAVQARNGKLAHPVNKPDASHKPESAFLSEDDFASVERWANTGEGVATRAVGTAVRGASWLSLNNEALAGIVETLVGVLVRKVSEKAAYCAYSCLDETQATSNGEDRLTFAPLEHVTYPIEVDYSGPDDE